ncbi:hypothetical protein [Actinomadura madurae]|uniref:hypothetical protein n=1 Tax=Actinomadura madurae TaxID=1993 RepID=UPI0020D206CF|nr:hypothetical protein [Actinomadura madurae]MCP9952880.1 hypothetical protein [Actinomadura madurae]MCP9969645.1 hypothetical protein [Actinomadura madurae]MCP9982100.1 hypothetical protein [Actinomadura madurae]MCQ0006374.1 hypothetical protein [Actinomadura madurae]MCQ0018341.1 hypothetical protein [Actinomadura madurae]
MSADETARLVRGLTPEERQAIALLDLQALVRENAGRDFKATEPAYGVLNCLRYWEVLISRMEEGWRRQDYYMVYEYLNVLTVRDGIDEFLDAMPHGLQGKVDVCVKRLDARYRAVTSEDGGVELSQYWRPLAEGRETRWWWTRCPNELPPGW